jgi:rubredoxin-NAD+ reductase
VVVAPPSAGAAGEWLVAAEPDGVTARFVSTDGALLGFALVGTATSRKAALQKALPNVLE